MSVSHHQNIVLMHCHDLGRFLGRHGVPTVRTPSLDTLAADGARFDNAFCTAPQCSPSRAALFTGRYPHSNGVKGLTDKNFEWDLHPGERHLAALLAEAGFETELLGVHHESRQRSDEDLAARLGFDRVRTGGAADIVADRAIESLRGFAGPASQRPFYLQIGLIEPHRLGPPTEGGTRVGFVSDYITADDSRGATVPGYLTDDESTRAEIAELQGAVTCMDRAADRVLEALADLSLADSTVLVFTTDHGLALPRAKCTLYEPELGGGVDRASARPRMDRWTCDRRPSQQRRCGPGPSRGGRRADPRAPSGPERGRTSYDRRESLTWPTPHLRRVHLPQLLRSTPPCPDGAARTHRQLRLRTRLHGRGFAVVVPVVHATLGLDGAQDDTVERYDLRHYPLELNDVAVEAEYGGVLDELRSMLVRWMLDTGDPLVAGAVESPAHRRAEDFLRH